MTTGLSVQATGTAQAQGLLVVSVPEHLRSSLHLYDIIVEAARQPVSSPEDLTHATSRLAADAPLLLKVRRFENGRTNERLIIVPR